MKVKAGPDVIDVLSLAHRSNQPVLLEGPHGIGKSELIEQAADALKIGFIVRDLSLMEPPDLIGLPVRREQGDRRHGEGARRVTFIRARRLFR